MIFTMNNAGVTTNEIYNKTKIVLSQSVNNSNYNSKINSKVFKPVTSISFSLSSSNKNVNYKKVKQTKNG